MTYCIILSNSCSQVLQAMSVTCRLRRSCLSSMATSEERTSGTLEACFNDKRRHKCLLGHKARTFDFQFHPTEPYAISASEDGTARIWDLHKNRCIKSLEGHKKYEVLRACWAPPGGVTTSAVTAATGSADGVVRLWGCSPSPGTKGEKTSDDGDGSSEAGFSSRLASLKVVGKLRHKDEARGLDGQVYSCQFIVVTDGGDAVAPSSSAARSSSPLSTSATSSHQGRMRLLTASDSNVHLWDVETQQRIVSQALAKVGHHSIGGGRNPEDLAFVFDAKPRPGCGSSTLAVALSDGTLRVGDILGGGCDQPIVLRRDGGANTHMTGLAWSADGLLLAACAGDGTVAVWDARTWTSRAILRGHSRPVYGASFFPWAPASAATAGGGGPGDGEAFSPTTQLLLSWSSDGTLCAWDVARASGEDTTPLATMSVEKGFPIYHCAVSGDGSRLAVAGGGSDGSSFVGVPITLVDLSARDDAG